MYSETISFFWTYHSANYNYSKNSLRTRKLYDFFQLTWLCSVFDVRFKDYKNHMFRHILFKPSAGRHVRIQEVFVLMRLFVCARMCERETD